MNAELPVEAALSELTAALSQYRRAVLVAPPGSGKTTRVAPALLASGLVQAGHEIVLLQPRRVAARAVAAFMARERGEAVGQTIGYQVRFDDTTSARTRIRVVTEGILTARLQRDPELSGVTLVILDEFHERSLHADLALALLREVQEGLRPDLMVLVMSATLAAEPVANFLGCPVVRAEGRVFPVEVSFAAEALDARDPRQIEDAMVRAVEQVHRDGLDGDVLCFLHGVRAIEGVRGRLMSRLGGVEVLPLHGSLSPREQDLALSSGARPRVVLATNVAETSLTIPGVTTVIDSGLAKVMRYDLAVGQDRLETSRISRASADQRSGRAGRVRSGRALRLWTRFEDERLRPFEDPEIRRVELMRMALELASWGVDPRTFSYFEAPEPRALDDALTRLTQLGALGRQGVTALGRAVLALPLPPRLAALVARVREADLATAVRWAVGLDQGLLEGDLGVRSTGPWPAAARQAEQQLTARRGGAGYRGAEPLGVALVRSHADRVGVRREDGRVALVGGRLARTTEGQAPDLLAAFDLEAGRRGEGAVSWLRAYAPIEREALEATGGLRLEDELVWEPDRRRVSAYRTEYWLDLALTRRSIPNVDRERSGALLAQQAAGALDQVFGALAREDEELVARVVTLFLAWPEARADAVGEVAELLTREAVLTACLPWMCEGLASFDELARRPAVSLSQAVQRWLGHRLVRRLDELLPERLEVPSGSLIRLAYHTDGRPPVLAVKLQELFGLTETPRVANGRLPVVLHLLSPAMRPLQVTSDLASFWSRTWPEVRAEMRTRYPKHIWPEDPTTAPPTQRTVQRRR